MVNRHIVRHHAKICEDGSICCSDITIFVTFKKVAATILDFQILEILMVWRPICVILPNFIKIRQVIA